jgi:hypothetical protein
VLYIISKEGTYQWHVGEPTPFPKEVRELQADGDELAFIDRRINESCDNVPQFCGAVVSWFGDTAKFIWYNLLANSVK